MVFALGMVGVGVARLVGGGDGVVVGGCDVGVLAGGVGGDIKHRQIESSRCAEVQVQSANTERIASVCRGAGEDLSCRKSRRGVQKRGCRMQMQSESPRCAEVRVASAGAERVLFMFLAQLFLYCCHVSQLYRQVAGFIQSSRLVQAGGCGWCLVAPPFPLAPLRGVFLF